jgi:hypothetical protein
MRIYCGNWKRRIRGPEGGWIVRFPGTQGQAGNKNKSEKTSTLFAARNTSVNSPQFTHDFSSKKPRSASCFSQNPVEKETLSHQIINLQKSTTNPITIAQ